MKIIGECLLAHKKIGDIYLSLEYKNGKEQRDINLLSENFPKDPASSMSLQSLEDME